MFNKMYYVQIIQFDELLFCLILFLFGLVYPNFLKTQIMKIQGLRISQNYLGGLIVNVFSPIVVSPVYFSALVWGSSVKHQPQKVGKDHILNDEDVVQIVKK